jgi:hypothetical protein
MDTLAALAETLNVHLAARAYPVDLASLTADHVEILTLLKLHALRW